MYEKGDLVVYGNMGVCTVTDVTVPEFCPPGEERTYYVLAPNGQSGQVYAPTDAPVFMRPVITKEEADRLIALIPTLRAEAYHSAALQELNAHYSQALKSHSCRDLIELVMSIYVKKQDRIRRGQKIGAVDESYMKRAEALLYGEFAAALGIPEEEVQGYIAAGVKRKS